MNRNSLLRLNVVIVSFVCLIGLSSNFQQSIMADMICDIGTVTGFANNSGGAGDNSSPPASFTIDLTGLGTDAAGNGFLDLTTFGDFSNQFEYIDISIESVSLGRLWNNDTTLDRFVGNNADNDIGQEYGENRNNSNGNASAVAQLTESELDTFLADGVLTISLEMFGAQVNNLNGTDETDEFITAKVTINEATAVPEPGGWLIATFISIVGVVRRKRLI